MLLEHVGQPLQTGESAQTKLELALSYQVLELTLDQITLRVTEVSHIFLIYISQDSISILFKLILYCSLL